MPVCGAAGYLAAMLWSLSKLQSAEVAGRPVLVNAGAGVDHGVDHVRPAWNKRGSC